MKRTRIASAALVLILGATSSRAESPGSPGKDIAKGAGVVVELKSGQELKGLFLGRRDGAVWIGTDRGEIGVEPETIVALKPAPTDDAEFLKRKAAVPKGDAAAWWELAKWAQKRDLNSSARLAATKTIEFDPEHAAARLFLGDKNKSGLWLNTDESKQAQGLVNFEGEWLTREQIGRKIDARRRPLRAPGPKLYKLEEPEAEPDLTPGRRLLNNRRVVISGSGFSEYYDQNHPPTPGHPVVSGTGYTEYYLHSKP